MAEPNDPNAQFNVMRQRAGQAEAGNLQKQRDALARRAAQLGGGPSGALIKQESIASDQSAQRLQGANEGIDAAQTAENRRIREMEDARKFQTSERLGSQEFSAAQREEQNKFGAQEAMALRAAAEDARLENNRFASQEAMAGRAVQEDQWGKTFNQLGAQQQFENENNQKTNVLNSVLSMKNSGFNPDQIRGMLSSLGLDKLGIDINSIPGLTLTLPSAAPAAAKPTNAAPQATTYNGKKAVTGKASPAGGTAYYNPGNGQRVG